MVNSSLLKYLQTYLTEERHNTIQRVVAERTRYITVVLEDIYHSQNASAVLRTCDCFGIQDVHVIENQNEYDINPDVTLGSNKWVSRHHYNTQNNNTNLALQTLKDKGYRIIATCPHSDDIDLESFDINAGKFALVFGTEQTGVSDNVKRLADAHLKIPMYGFTESFNISVSAAICLHHLVWRLKKSSISWQLSKEESELLQLEWVKKSIKRPELIIERFNNEQ